MPAEEIAAADLHAGTGISPLALAGAAAETWRARVEILTAAATHAAAAEISRAAATTATAFAAAATPATTGLRGRGFHRADKRDRQNAGYQRLLMEHGTSAAPRHQETARADIF